MKRIVVIGCGGSGKTALANRLASLLDLPVTHLDALYYDARWQTTAPDLFAAAQRDLVAADRWLIDGNYASTLPLRLARADTVIFCDLPALTCLWGIAQRRWHYRGGRHPDGTHDRMSWSFLRYVMSYRRVMRPRIAALVAEHAGHARYIRLPRRRDIHRLLRLIATTGARPT